MGWTSNLPNGPMAPLLSASKTLQEEDKIEKEKEGTRILLQYWLGCTNPPIYQKMIEKITIIPLGPFNLTILQLWQLYTHTHTSL